MSKATIQKLQSELGDIKTKLEEERDSRQEKFDDKSDNWKEGDAGQAEEARIEALTEAVDALEQIDSNLDDATND